MHRWISGALTLCVLFLLPLSGCASVENQTGALTPEVLALAADSFPADGEEEPEPSPPAPTLEEIRQIAFTDVADTAAYRDAVSYAAYLGLLQGVGGNRFNPDGLVTRATAVTVLWRMSGQEEVAYQGTFADVAADAPYAVPVAWALETGVVTGTADGDFRPEDHITRAQLAIMVYRYARYMGYETGLPAGVDTEYDITGFAREPVIWAIESGVCRGLVGNGILPGLSVSRGQLAQALVGLLAWGNGDELAAGINEANPATQVESKSLAAHDRIQTAVDTAAQRYGAVGLQVAVIEDGVPTDSFAAGWATRGDGGAAMTADHKMRVASISKVVLGMAAMALAEDGVVDLDAGIGDYWGFRVVNPYYTNETISLRSLLSHTSSIFLAGDDVSREYNAVRSRLSAGTGFNRGKPGSMSSWGYNNYAFGVLGMTLELAAGQVMDDILDEHFLDVLEIDAAFEPGCLENKNLLATLYSHGGGVTRSRSAQLGMGLPSQSPGASGRYFAGGYMTSANDLAKLVALLANDGVYEGLRLLSEESVALMETRVGAVSGGFEQALPLRYQENIYGCDALYYHTGSAYGVYNCISYDPATGDGVVVLTTGASAARDDNGIYAVCGAISEEIYATIR